MYGLVRNNAVTQRRDIPPEVFTRPDGSVVAGYHLRPDLWAADGWLAVVDVGPQPTATQTGTEVLTPNGTQLDRTFTNIAANVPVVNRQAIEAALTAALAQIDTDRATLQGAMATANQLAGATIANVAAAQTAVRAIGALFQNLLPALGHSADNQKRLIRLARGALDASD